MSGWMKHKLESRLLGKIAITSDMQKTPLLIEESDEELNGLLMKLKEHSGKVCLKLNFQKTKIMASGPITSWKTGETMETVRDFIFGLYIGLKVADIDCRCEIKRCLLLGRKVMVNLDSILKRNITLLTKVSLVKAMVFSLFSL